MLFCITYGFLWVSNSSLGFWLVPDGILFFANNVAQLFPTVELTTFLPNSLPPRLPLFRPNLDMHLPFIFWVFHSPAIWLLAGKAFSSSPGKDTNLDSAKPHWTDGASLFRSLFYVGLLAWPMVTAEMWVKIKSIYGEKKSKCFLKKINIKLAFSPHQTLAKKWEQLGKLGLK